MYGGIDYKVENDREGEKFAKIGKFLFTRGIFTDLF